MGLAIRQTLWLGCDFAVIHFIVPVGLICNSLALLTAQELFPILTVAGGIQPMESGIFLVAFIFPGVSGISLLFFLYAETKQDRLVEQKC